MSNKKMALGRGLGALIDDASYEPKTEAVQQIVGSHEIEIEKIVTNPFQPRTKFDQEALEELAESIKHLGIIQPLSLRKKNGDNKYELIAGERRLRAAKLAGLDKVPAFVREANDQEMLEMALVENIQRENLNAIEIAITYQRLIDECSITHDVLSERVGKNRSSVSNYLRLLKLPAEIQIGIRDKFITFGHARALINFEDPKEQIKTYFLIVNKGLSVRQVEELAKNINSKEEKQQKTVENVDIPEEISSFAHNLKENLQSNVQFMRSSNGRGKIVIPFKSDSDLNRLMGILNKIAN